MFASFECLTPTKQIHVNFQREILDLDTGDDPSLNNWMIEIFVLRDYHENFIFIEQFYATSSFIRWWIQFCSYVYLRAVKILWNWTVVPATSET